MAKEKKFPNDSNDTFENTRVEKYEQSKEKLYNVVFKGNRSREINVGREILKFEAHIVNPVYPEKYKDGLPESIVNHKDFQLQKNDFSIIAKEE